MKIGKIKEEKGITLIALVITIIVLLILAGVSLSLIVGEDGITQRAITAAETYDIAGAKEQADLLVASYAGEFYQEKYISGNEAATNIGDYISEQLKSGEDTGDYTVKTDKRKITVSKGEEELATGTINDDGTVDWTKTPFDPSTIELGTEANAVDAGKYGWKVTNYKSKYEEDNNITLTWRLFYKDSNYAYIILDTFDAELNGTVKTYKPSDYYGEEKYSNGSKVSMVGQKLNPLISTLFVDTNENYNIKATAWLTDTEYWDKYTDKNGKALYAIASPTAELFRNSFNATASTNGASTITLGKETYGYTENTGIQQLKSTYNNGIYNKDGSTGWWLASPCYGSISNELSVSGSDGYFGNDYVNSYFFAVRPLVCLPASEVPTDVLINE